MITQERTSTLLEKKYLSEESSLNSAYTIELIAAVREAQAEINRGEFITLEEFEKEFFPCFIK